MSEPLLTALLLLLYTFVLPLAGAGGAIWFTRRWSSTGRIAPAHRGALAFLVGALFALWGILGVGIFWGPDVKRFLSWGAVAIGVGIVLCERRGGDWAAALGLPLFALTLTLLHWGLLAPRAEAAGGWGVALATGWTLASLVTALFVWAILARESAHRNTPAFCAPLALCAAGSGIILALSGTLALGQTLAAIGLPLALIGLYGWRSVSVTFGPAALASFILLYEGIILAAHHYSSPSIPIGLIATLALAPLAQCLLPRSLSPRAGVAAGLLLTLPLLALSLYGSVAWDESLERAEAAAAEEDGYGYGYGD